MVEGIGNLGFEAKVEAENLSAERGAPDRDGRIQLAQVAPSASAPAPVAPPPAVHFDAAASKVVRLPQGTSLDNIEISGKDIILKQADGRTIVIDNGVSSVPTLMVGDVEVPAETLAAVFSSQGIIAAAGPAGAQASNLGSSGGNFSLPNGNVGSFFGLTDLLPPTDLQFATLEQRELGVVRRPSVGPSALSSTANMALSEAALASGSESGRADEIGRAVLSFNTGSLPVSGVRFASDLGSLQTELNGLPGADIVWVRLSDTAIVGRVGGVDAVLLQIEPATGQGFGTIDVVVTTTLLGPVPHAPGEGLQPVDLGSIGVVVETGAGTAQGNIQISVSDDVPTVTVSADAPSVVEGQVLGGTWSQTLGADAPGSVTKVVVGGVEYDLGTAIAVAGLGTLTVAPDGTWSFASANNLNNAAALPVSFSVKVTDGDGDVATDDVSFTITDGAGPTAVNPREGALALTVDERDLRGEAGPGEGGETPSEGSAADSGALSFTSGSDAIISIVFADPNAAGNAIAADLGLNEGVTISWVRSADGRTLTGSIEGQAAIVLTLGGSQSAAAGGATVSPTVTATLTDNFPHQDNANAGQLVLSGIKVVASDGDGDSAVGAVTVRVVDDVPTAIADGPHAVVEDGLSLVSGNVLSNDMPGADGQAATVTWDLAGDAAAIAALGQYGTLTQNPDGTWSYQLDNSRAATQALGAGFSQDFVLHYTMQDQDGDPSPAALTITVTGTKDSAKVTTAQAEGPDATVSEAGLASGSAAATAQETTTGSFTVTATDGIASIVVGGVTFTLAQMQAFATTNGVVNTGEGALRLTGYDPATGVVSYSYTLAATIDNDSHAGATGTGFDDAIALQVNGIGGTSASDTLVVRIVDDAPQAVDDGGYTVVEDGAGSVSGNVLSNDLHANGQPGADGQAATVTWDLAGDAAAIAALGLYGTLTQNPDGTWSYQLDNSRAATQALGAGVSQDFVLHYTMQDQDGDPSQASLTITVTGTKDSAKVTTAQAEGPDATVSEAGLASGSAAATSQETATGSFTVTATDGIASIVVGGVTFTLAQMQAFATTNGVVDTGEGALRLTGYDPATGVVSYSYTLAATIDNDSHAGATGTGFDDAIALQVNGIGGTSASDTLVVRIVDDAPQAVDDGGYTVVEDGAGSVSGNVLSNDLHANGQPGADGQAATVTWDLAGDAAAIAALGLYGTLTQNPDGTWSYQLDNSRAATQALGGGFSQDFVLHYTMQDNDGDPSQAALTITVTGAKDSAKVTTAQAEGPDATVSEAGLASGSAAATSQETATGSFTVTATDGIASIVVGGVTFTLAQMQAFATTNGVVDTGEGALRLTGYDPATGVVSYSYTLAATIDNDSHAGATGTGFDDAIPLQVNGIGGTSASDTLVVRIVDDAPQAVEGPPLTVQETDGPTFGTNLLANDVRGADGARLTAVDFGLGNGLETIAAGGTTTITDANGTYTFQADGTWSFDPAVSPYSWNTTGSFTYQITDGDGDSWNAPQTVKIMNVNNLPTGGTVTATVDDEGLAHGIAGGTGDAATNSASFSGTLTGSGGDGALSFSFTNLNGTTATIGQETVTYSWNSASNVLTATITASTDPTRVNSGLFTVALTPSTGAYTLTLLDNVLHAQGNNAESGDLTLALQYSVGDSDGDTSIGDTGIGTLNVTFDDDSPVGFTAQPMTIENGANSVGSGALNFYESIGADGGSVVFSGGADGAVLKSGTKDVTSGGKTVFLYGFGTDTLTGKIDLDGNGIKETTVFTVKLSPSATSEANDVYTTQFFRALDDGSGNTITPTNFSDTSSSRYKVVEGDNNDDILISAVSSPNSRVNGSNGGGVTTLGAGGGVDIGSGELLRFDFASGVTVSGGGNNSITSASLSHYNVNGFTTTVDNSSGLSRMLFTVYDADNDTNLTDDSFSKDTITQIYKNGVLLILGVEAIASSGGYLVYAGDGDQISIFTLDGYNRVEVAYSSGSEFALANVGYLTSTLGDPVPLNFSVTATDADGDTSTGAIAVTTTPFASTFNGTAGDDLLVAGNAGETLNGQAGNDTLIGGVGADTFNGGTHGSVGDTVSYQNSTVGVTVDLSLVATAQSSTGDASGDKLSSIENLIGSNVGDTLLGDSSANTLAGLGGNDTLSGRAGNDTLIGGAGADTLDGGTNTAAGDTASYLGSSAGVTVDLNLVGIAQSSAGDASGDRLSNIENLIGSDFADSLTGDGNANTLSGLAGNDTLSGAGGSDTLIGGAGHDTLNGGSGSDVFVLDSSNLSVSDLIEDYNYSGGTGDVVDLSAVLEPLGVTAANVGDYVHLANGGTELQVDSNGGAAGGDVTTVATFNTPQVQVSVLYDENQPAAPVT